MTPPAWLTARGELSLHVPRIMGILNVTPDSFSDGGQFLTPESAVAQAERLLTEGADLLDIGGESTRPGARPVSAEQELERVVPVIREVLRRRPETIVSIDTVKAEVARGAVEAGAAIVNDVSGFRLDAEIARVTARTGAGALLMHSRGTVEDMANYATAVYGSDPVAEIQAELHAAAQRALDAGVDARAIVLDPGIGFSKRTEHSVAVLAQLRRLVSLGYPLLVGPSRKRFVGELTGGLPADQRLEGTIAACVVGLLNGARIFRVHDVGPVRRALQVAEAIRNSTPV
jgi:dihydropteroate synthase